MNKFPSNATQYNRILAKAGYKLELSKSMGTWYLVGEDAVNASDACTYCSSLHQMTPASLLHDAMLVSGKALPHATTEA